MMIILIGDYCITIIVSLSFPESKERDFRVHFIRISEDNAEHVLVTFGGC